MSLNVNEMKSLTSNTFGFPALGVHVARLVGVVDMGLQLRSAYKGVEKPACGKIALTFELTDDFIEIDGVKRPRWISKSENAFSSPQANLTALVAALDPANQFAGDLGKMAEAGLPCLITISPKTDVNGNPIEGVRISQVGGTPPGLAVSPLQNPSFVFDFDRPTEPSWEKLLKWQKDQIKQALNYPGSSLEALVTAYEEKLAAQPQQAQEATTQSRAGQGSPLPPNAPLAQPQTAPQAPPGYLFDEEAQGFKPVPVQALVQTEQKSPAAPPGWSFVDGTWVQTIPVSGNPY